MRRALFLVASLTFVTLGNITTYGQGGGGGFGGRGGRGSKAERRAETGEGISSAEFKLSRDQSKHLLKGIKLTGAEKDQVKAITKKYDEQYKSLDRQERAADPATQPERQFGPQWQAMRDLEKGELRAALRPEQQARFDENASPKPRKN